MARQNKVAKSVVASVLSDEGNDKRSKFAAIKAFFVLYRLKFVRYRNDLFSRLRNKTWKISEDEYNKSFEEEGALEPKGDMGYSGSTFFTTKDGRYLVKSVPRRFEHSFFRDDLLTPYVEHMEKHPGSLLVRITDFLACKYSALGGMIGLAPTHHVIMENLLHGKQEAEEAGRDPWEQFDLKPTSYFFPERDIAGGKLTSEATKARLADKFEDKIVLTRADAEGFLAQLEQDTQLLEQCNAVDYSLFLIRIPITTPQNPFADQDPDHDNAPESPQEPPFVPPGPPTWRTGIKSADDKYVFRATVLDFFWAKHKIHAKFMTALIKCWNLIDRKGPMSITTTSDEYRERFLKMCREMVEVKG